MKAAVSLQKGVHKAYKISRDAINRGTTRYFPRIKPSVTTCSEFEPIAVRIPEFSWEPKIQDIYIEAVTDIFDHRFNL